MEEEMRVKKLSNRLVLLSLTVVVMLAVCPFLNAACASARSAHSTTGKPATPPMAVASDVVTEWNQQAVSLTLAPASASTSTATPSTEQS